MAIRGPSPWADDPFDIRLCTALSCLSTSTSRARPGLGAPVLVPQLCLSAPLGSQRQLHLMLRWAGPAVLALYCVLDLLLQYTAALLQVSAAGARG